MKKTIIISIWLTIVTSVMLGQEHAINAANFLAENQIEAASKEMALALKDESENSNAYTWHINAFLLKERYKQNIQENKNYREQAIQAAKKSLDLDKEKKYAEKTNRIIKYLASTYLKEAYLNSRSTDTTKIITAKSLYQDYENAIKIVDPTTNFQETKTEVYIHVANQYERLFNQDKTNNSLIFNAIDVYKEVLKTDSLNYQANYNIAVDYYNLAVNEIGKIDASTPFWELIYIQEHSIELFKKSLPYMNIAYNQNPTRVHSLKGLMQIYRALGDDEKFLAFKEKTENAIRNKEKK